MFDNSVTILLWPNSWKDTACIPLSSSSLLKSLIRLTIFDDLKIFGVGKNNSPVDQFFRNILTISSNIIWYSPESLFQRERDRES